MNDLIRFPVWIALLAACFLVQSEAFAQQAEEPGQLHTIKTPGTHEVFVGDVMQIRYKTQATINGIRTLRSETDGAILSRLALMNSPLDPDVQQVPGAPYFVIVYLKAERVGQATVRVTPLMNDGKQGVTFQFIANVRGR